MSGQRDGLATYLTAQRTTPTNNLLAPELVLAVGAHPDDIEFGCGATLAKWSRAGAKIHLAVLTDGRRGTWEPDQDQLALSATRRMEATQAATVLGAQPPHFFDQIDGELQATPALIMRLVALMRTLRPTVVITHDPWKRYRLHPDHRVAGQVTLDALVQARDATFWPELTLAASRPNALLLFEADLEDHDEHVDESHLSTKAMALACHHSQYRSSYGIPPEQATQATDLILARLRDVAHRDGKTSERFKLIADL